MTAQTGTVVFFDLVGFSTETDLKQVHMAQGFMNALGEALGQFWQGPPSKSKDSPYRILPTGDGAAVVIWQCASDHKQREFTALWLGAWLLVWAKLQGYGLRCGINSGKLELITDPYGDYNVCSAAINMAARIVDAADPGQLLVSSDTVVPKLQADNGSVLRLNYEITPEIHEILAKHDALLDAQSVTGELSIEGPVLFSRFEARRECEESVFGECHP